MIAGPFIDTPRQPGPLVSESESRPSPMPSTAAAHQSSALGCFRASCKQAEGSGVNSKRAVSTSPRILMQLISNQ
eukprot:750937-Hanusia_phi.AAC.4